MNVPFPHFRIVLHIKCSSSNVLGNDENDGLDRISRISAKDNFCGFSESGNKIWESVRRLT